MARKDKICTLITLWLGLHGRHRWAMALASALAQFPRGEVNAVAGDVLLLDCGGMRLTDLHLPPLPPNFVAFKLKSN